MNKTTKAIALYGVMLATLFVAMTMDRVFSSFLGISFAIVSVASTAALGLTRKNPLEGFMAGLFFGISSFLTAFMFGKTTFFNPLVSVLPRALMGISAFLVYWAVEKLLFLIAGKNSATEYIALSIGGLSTALLNTVFTLTCMRLFASGDPFFTAFSSLFLLNILPEMAVATALTPPLVLGIRHGLGLGIDGKKKMREAPAARVSADSDAENNELKKEPV